MILLKIKNDLFKFTPSVLVVHHAEQGALRFHRAPSTPKMSVYVPPVVARPVWVLWALVDAECSRGSTVHVLHTTSRHLTGHVWISSCHWGKEGRKNMKFSGNYTLKCKKTNQTKKHPQKENVFKKKNFKYSHQEPCRCKSYTSLFFKSLKLMSVKKSFLLLNFLSLKKIII